MNKTYTAYLTEVEFNRFQTAITLIRMRAQEKPKLQSIFGIYIDVLENTAKMFQEQKETVNFTEEELTLLVRSLDTWISEFSEKSTDMPDAKDLLTKLKTVNFTEGS